MEEGQDDLDARLRYDAREMQSRKVNSIQFNSIFFIYRRMDKITIKASKDTQLSYQKTDVITNTVIVNRHIHCRALSKNNIQTEYPNNGIYSALSRL